MVGCERGWDNLPCHACYEVQCECNECNVMSKQREMGCGRDVQGAGTWQRDGRVNHVL
jgi:hypothetical protein